jgi:primosomal replication protein N
LNRVGLTASLLEREAIRYTPAGIPIVALRLAHRSVQREAGMDRTIEMDVPAVAADKVALRIDRVALGTELVVSGFLAPRRRNARALVLHLTEFELGSTSDRTV